MSLGNDVVAGRQLIAALGLTMSHPDDAMMALAWKEALVMVQDLAMPALHAFISTTSIGPAQLARACPEALDPNDHSVLKHRHIAAGIIVASAMNLLR